MPNIPGVVFIGRSRIVLDQIIEWFKKDDGFVVKLKDGTSWNFQNMDIVIMDRAVQQAIYTETEEQLREQKECLERRLENQEKRIEGARAKARHIADVLIGEMIRGSRVYDKTPRTIKDLIGSIRARANEMKWL